MVHGRIRVPDFEEGVSSPIRGQCCDASSGGLNPDDEIRFAIAVTLEVADTVRYDVHHEVREGVACSRSRRGVGEALSSTADTRAPGGCDATADRKALTGGWSGE